MDAEESVRILTVSSSVECATAFIESLKSLTDPLQAKSVPSSLSPSVPLTIPWTISNRYYIADVHFSVWTIDRLFPELFARQPPAVVFTWFEDESYAKCVAEIARLMKLGDYEPEVALAVRIPGLSSSSPSTSPLAKETSDSLNKEDRETDENENGDIDSTLSSYGFEYVDATRPTLRDSEGLRKVDNNDIPALPRVLDALSTIMWPSMRSTKTGSDIGSQRPIKGGRISLDFNRSFDSDDEDSRKEREELMQELLLETIGGGGLGVSSSMADDQVQLLSEKGRARDESVDEELMEQMKTFVMDTERKSQTRERPWVSTSPTTTASTSNLTMSPSEMNDEAHSMSPFQMHRPVLGDERQKEELSLRFDDDFTVFVSAPHREAVEEEKTIHSTGLDFGKIGPPGGGLTAEHGFRYQSLGSVSDFGEDDDIQDDGHYEVLEDGDLDEDIPTKAEIEDTRRRIFGHSGALDEEGQRGFDLEKTFGVLQEYKGEIAGMDNNEERRSTAARVALGMVYGLEGRRKS